MTRALPALLIAAFALCACAMFKSVARTAVDAARDACHAFGDEVPEAERPLGLSTDECIDLLLSAHQAKVAAAQAKP